MGIYRVGKARQGLCYLYLQRYIHISHIETEVDEVVEMGDGRVDEWACFPSTGGGFHPTVMHRAFPAAPLARPHPDPSFPTSLADRLHAFEKHRLYGARWIACPHDKYDPQGGDNPEGKGVTEDDRYHSDHEKTESEKEPSALKGCVEGVQGFCMVCERGCVEGVQECKMVCERGCVEGVQGCNVMCERVRKRGCWRVQGVCWRVQGVCWRVQEGHISWSGSQGGYLVKDRQTSQRGIAKKVDGHDEKRGVGHERVPCG